jgi:hypothetical protein
MISTANELIVRPAAEADVHDLADMFWAKFGGDIEWLYVRPEARGIGIACAGRS